MKKKSLGNFIALLRKEKNLTQKQLAELLNVSDKTISHWECDETSPDILILPELAELLGVSVDELLKGEKIPSEASHNSFSHYDRYHGKLNSLFTKIKDGFTGELSERYRYFRILSLIGTVIACVVLLSLLLSVAFSAYFFHSSIPIGLIALLGSLWTIVLSLGFTLGARFLFSKIIIPSKETDEGEGEYIFKANRTCFNNLFLLFCAFPLALAGIDILPVVANLLIVLAFVAAIRLTATVILMKKGYLKRNDKQMLLTKYISICLASVISVCGAVLLFTEAFFYSSPKNIIFYSPEEFKAYMETPKDKPENAFMIDGVMMTTFVPTTFLSSGWNDGAVAPPPADNEAIETVCGYYGEEISFIWLNKEVYDYGFNDDEGTFHVITYEAKIEAKNKEILVDDGIPILLVLFSVTNAVTCFTLYKRKMKQLKNGE
ncbi:MAG: helix-turn-helix transcriptional regulator [Ruminococcaceae bacterium]|nr:helix-turn-helix transcriptional regulator [Oscillospiraceae bacterium]